MRIALAQIDTTIGDFDANLAKVAQAAHDAANQGARLVVAPELTVTGYPPRDFLEQPEFLDRSLAALDRFVADALPPGVAVAVGYAQPHEQPGARVWNAAVVVQDGRIVARARKLLLPTYDVFDEARYFDPGDDATLFEIDGVPVGLTICEDLWNDRSFWSRRRYERDVADELTRQGAQVIVNLSASPYAVGKPALRERMLATTARRLGVPIALCNLVGGNDGLIFDGTSLALDADGRSVRVARSFEEELAVVDLKPRQSQVTPTPQTPEAPHRAPGEAALLTTPLATELDDRALDELFDALVCGTRDYARKTGFKSAVLGLSGGIDSALVAVVAAHAFGPEHVTTVAMPSRFTEEISITDAQVLAANIGVSHRVLNIEKPFGAYLDVLGPMFVGLEWDVTEENLQARIRGATLMALSNKFGSLLLTTGNKSELATGYCTLYGDMCGGLAVIGDVPKTLVWALSSRVNRRAGREVIPERTIARPPSAELRADQRDQDSLPPYEVLDRILRRFVEARESEEEIARAEPDIERAVIERVARLVRRSEYKRRQAAPVLRVTPRAFGDGWRFPIAHRVR